MWNCLRAKDAKVSPDIFKWEGNDVMRNNLKEARHKAGMTQKQVAEYLGITIRSYQRIENGERIGEIKTWDMLEDLFCINQRRLRELTSNQFIK